MKKTILILTALLSGLVFQNARAQLHVGINFNIGSQPVWGPTGYDHVEYYYMPDIDAYYYVPNHQYIYLDRGRWIFSSNLPSRFHFDLYSGYKVVVNEPAPYRNAEMYRTKYSGYKGQHNQEIIRNSHEQKYFEVRDHPQHNEWKKDNKFKNGHDNRENNQGHGKGHHKDK